MKTSQSFKTLSLLIFLIANCQLLIAGGGDDHTHGDETPTPTAQEQKYSTSEAVSDKYELLIRYEHIHIGEPTHLTLFVSEYATNKPVDKADIKIAAQEDSQLVFTVEQSGEGTYTVETTFPEKKKYSLAVNINSALGADLILLSNIDAGMEIPHEEEEAHKHFSLGDWQIWLAILAALVVGLGIGLLLQKRNTKAGKQFISCLLLFTYWLIPVQNNIAHGDDDHGAAKTGNNFSNSFHVPKETQFLFDVFTEKISVGSFTGSTKLFGTIIPSSNGQAIVSTPQNGKIISLNVRVGGQVKAGQQLAVIEQNIDAETQVSFMAEKNTLAAEYDAAKKEFDRLNSIKDIAAKKDVDEATARLQKAETNLRLFKGNLGKTISLTAPISGVVANFNLSIGSTVSAGQTLFTITNLKQIYAEAQVFDKDAHKVQEGAKFTIECVNNDSHKTSDVKLLSLAQEINATNQSQRVLFELKNPDGDFKIGEFVNIRVFASESSHLIALPNSAITEINGKPVVFIKDAAETYTVRYVQLGENNGTHTGILKGIEEGERVVNNSGYQLKMIYLNQ
ncbi:MAG: efflux RND transporter periplasmic adaptor subunit [Sphingobacteriales bacterium]|nr:MAG: efflux RND transporter periplasmic adaptor subunit [Sphingobacteriales bacterium]